MLRHVCLSHWFQSACFSARWRNPKLIIDTAVETKSTYFTFYPGTVCLFVDMAGFVSLFFLWCLLKFLSRKGVYSPVNDIINYKKHWKQKSRSPINTISGCCLATAVNLISGQPIIFNHSVLLFWRTQHVSFAIDIHFFVSVDTIFKRRQPQLTDIQCW